MSKVEKYYNRPKTKIFNGNMLDKDLTRNISATAQDRAMVLSDQLG